MDQSRKRKILIHAWSLSIKEDEYYIPFTHWIYLKEIVKYYDRVVLLSPVRRLSTEQKPKGESISCFENVSVYPLPFTTGGYIGSLKYFLQYNKAYKSIKGITTYYARYPVPFGWLQKLYSKNSTRIVHYVGDPIDAAKNNPNFSSLKKKVLINGFRLENALYHWACKGAQVYTNGHHIAERLMRKGIQAKALISSTLTEDDFFFEEKVFDKDSLKFVYLGYLRKAKGVETIIKAFSKVQEKFPFSRLTVIGSGEFEVELKDLSKRENIKNVNFMGHVEDRNIINKTLREHDFFLFGSLSEGSPRVVLEAMANGLVVVSTPVGSLPQTFIDGDDIIFADFNNVEDFRNKIFSATNDSNQYNNIRKNAFMKVKNFTIENFIKEIFYED